MNRIFYILVFTIEDKMYRMLFATAEKRSNYILKKNIIDYTLNEISIEGEES